jgi:flagellar hook-associated protein 3 FlgL
MPSRITTTTMARRILADVAAANYRLVRTQERLASGKELTRPSDNPAAVGRAIHLRREMEAAKQHQRNASEAQGWTEVTDSALSSIADLLMRVRELTVQAATDTSGGASRANILEELRGVIDSIKTAGNATYGGRYVFAGSRTDTKPYQMGADDTFAGDTAQVFREIGPGVAVPINISGADFLGDGTTGLLGTVRTVMEHLQTGTAEDLTADLDLLDSRLDELNAVRATVGATANRLEVAMGRLSEYEGTTLKLLSETEDADIARAMIDFSTQQAALTAGLKAGASIVQTSLLDFLR